MLLAALCYTVETSLIKYIGTDWTPFGQVFWRQVFALMLILPFILRRPTAAFVTARPLTMMFRSLMNTTGHVLSVVSFSQLPLATASALSYSRPMWMALLGVLVLKEALRPSRFAAAGIGFAGVLIALNPFATGGGELWPAVAGLASALALAIGIASIKSMSADHSTFTLLCYAILFGLVLALPMAVMNWRTPSGAELGLFALMGAAHVGSIILYVKALSLADASVVSNFEYMRLVFALIAGFIVFREWPALNVWVGAVVILSSLMFVFGRPAKARPPRPCE